MDIFPRVRGIILKPQIEWAKIKEEQITVDGLLKSYLLILAAIPSAAQFLGFWLIGASLPSGVHLRIGFGSSLARAVVSYVLSLASVFIAALVIEALAPNFSSRPNRENAMKLVTYSMTPYFVAGVFFIFPGLTVLVIMAGIYGLYVLYLGFQNGLMETPKEKVMGYFILTLVVDIVLVLAMSLIVGVIFPLRHFYRGL
ncbi:MAG: Yip1 family protein [Candidatus Saccharicenans sp.]